MVLFCLFVSTRNSNVIKRGFMKQYAKGSSIETVKEMIAKVLTLNVNKQRNNVFTLFGFTLKEVISYQII